MKSKLLENSITFLQLSDDINELLNNNNINTINDLWCLDRKSLKGFHLSDKDIQKIIIKLQLHGLDLNKKKY